MMQLGVRMEEEGTKVIEGHITFDSGKKIILTAAEVEEFKSKIRMYKVAAKLTLEQQLMKALDPLTLILDWYNQAPITELHAVEDAIEFEFPHSALMNALHIILKEEHSDIQRKSLERIKKEEQL